MSYQGNISPKRFVMYAGIAAVGLAGLGYFLHDSSLYFAAIGLFLIGFGISKVFGRAQEAVAKYQSSAPQSQWFGKILILMKRLAIPTAFAACFILFDLYRAKPLIERGTVVEKHTGPSGRNGTSYYLTFKTNRSLVKSVSFSMYDAAQINDQVELIMTPFNQGLRWITIEKRTGVKIRGRSEDFYWGLILALLSFIPCSLFVWDPLPMLEKNIKNISTQLTGVFFVVGAFSQVTILVGACTILVQYFFRR